MININSALFLFCKNLNKIKALKNLSKRLEGKAVQELGSYQEYKDAREKAMKFFYDVDPEDWDKESSWLKKAL